LLSALGAALLAACAGRRADDASERARGATGSAMTLWTGSTELFMEHPALIVGAPDKFAVHLTDQRLRAAAVGRITLRFSPRGGRRWSLSGRASPGIYGPAPAFTRPGSTTSRSRSRQQARDVIRVSTLRVYASAEEAPKEEAERDAGIPS
jgi:hypothetical protein